MRDPRELFDRFLAVHASPGARGAVATRGQLPRYLHLTRGAGWAVGCSWLNIDADAVTRGNLSAAMTASRLP